MLLLSKAPWHICLIFANMLCTKHDQIKKNFVWPGQVKGRWEITDKTKLFMKPGKISIVMALTAASSHYQLQNYGRLNPTMSVMYVKSAGLSWPVTLTSEVTQA